MGWRRAFLALATNVEELFDDLTARLDRRLGTERLQIVAYRSFGTPTAVIVRGRVLEKRRITTATDHDSVWRNLANTYRRFTSDEIPGAHVRATLGSVSAETTSNKEGFFELTLLPDQVLNSGWTQVDLALLNPILPGSGPVHATAEVLIPPANADFGIISDIDDTVIKSDITNLLRMARLVFLGNARTRLPFPGVAAFYRALQAGRTSTINNPIFYVSSSPWNIYDLLCDFFALQGLPAGPMTLRDWGLNETEALPTDNRQHKHHAIRAIIERYPGQRWLLIGDSGQQDPEIYTALAQNYPGQILAIYIRNLDHRPGRTAEIAALQPLAHAAGTPLIFSAETLPLAEHAAAHGWIAAQSLAGVAANQQFDHTPASAIDTALNEDPTGKE
jgi:phosphatidate phosphatase APP1